MQRVNLEVLYDLNIPADVLKEQVLSYFAAGLQKKDSKCADFFEGYKQRYNLEDTRVIDRLIFLHKYQFLNGKDFDMMVDWLNDPANFKKAGYGKALVVHQFRTNDADFDPRSAKAFNPAPVEKPKRTYNKKQANIKLNEETSNGDDSVQVKEEPTNDAEAFQEKETEEVGNSNIS